MAVHFINNSSKTLHAGRSGVNSSSPACSFALSFALFNDSTAEATIPLHYGEAFGNENFRGPEGARLCILNSDLNQGISHGEFAALSKILTSLDKAIIFNRYRSSEKSFPIRSSRSSRSSFSNNSTKRSILLYATIELSHFSSTKVARSFSPFASEFTPSQTSDKVQSGGRPVQSIGLKDDKCFVHRL